MTARIVVRQADAGDLDWMARLDGHLDRDGLAAKAAAGEVLVAEIDGAAAGLLRFDRLWSAVPFVALVRVREPFRRRGVGRALVEALAQRARASGAAFVLSSASGDEADPQRWHRAVGFEECGRLAGINRPGVPEVFFRRPA